MRANLVGGRLIPPTSADAGRDRLRQLEHEIPKIEGQLAADVPDRDRDKHLAWRARAQGNLGWLREEKRQLEAWLRSSAEEEEHAAFWRE